MLNLTLAELASTLPGATAIFHHHGLSFCCGGQHTLEDACRKKGLPLDQILAELEVLGARSEQGENWQDAGDEAVIAHILERYHNVHREQLPELTRLARRVEKVHCDHPYCPHGLADFLDFLYEDLQQHMQKEEQVLFPMLLRGMGSQALGPIQAMTMEHGIHEKQLEDLQRITQNLSLPAGACNTWRALYMGLDEFERDLRQHIALENEILFARHSPASAA